MTEFLSRAQGFGDEAQEFMRELIRRGQADDPGILYTYSNFFTYSRPNDVDFRNRLKEDNVSAWRQHICTNF